MSRRAVRWQGEPALSLGTARLHALIVPGRAAKIASLVADGRQWLLQPRFPLPPPARPGTAFVEAEMCGWDEMVPTIDACRLPDGTSLPDHGEAWTALWDVERDGEAILAEARGTILPWRLRRRLSADGDDLLLDYELAVLGDTPVPLMWAAHPQFMAHPHTRLVLPSRPFTVIDVHGDHRGRVSQWSARGAVGMAALAPGACRKAYVHPYHRVGSAALIDGDGRSLHLSWDHVAVPYLGLWWDHCAYAPTPVIAVEPSTAWYDDLDYASRNGTAALIHPGEPHRWRLRLSAPR